MPLKVYAYKNCDTCRKSKKWLDSEGIAYTEIPIREQPPTKAECKRMLSYMDGNLRKLFNTAGGDYREMGLKDTLPSMGEAEAITLLTENGNLVKRPFVISKDSGTVGFDAARWAELFG